MTVLDASAVLALLNDEPGADLVERSLKSAVLCSVSLAEVVGKLVDVGFDPTGLRSSLDAAGVVVEAFSSEDAVLAGAMRELPGGRQLSLGDRSCLALAVRVGGPEVLTADRAWSDLDLPLSIRLIR